jgi:hypothetical protein
MDHFEGAKYRILVQCDHKNLEYFQTCKVCLVAKLVKQRIYRLTTPKKSKALKWQAVLLAGLISSKATNGPTRLAVGQWNMDMYVCMYIHKYIIL